MSQPGGATRRIESLDALRGFALFGILLINIQVFSGWGFVGSEAREALSWSWWDDQLRLVVETIARGKFYSLFSLLFGYSFVMLARKTAGAPVRNHLNRMLGLMVFGALHAVLLWPWDILFFYGAVGLVLALFLNRTPGVLAAWAAALLAITGALRWYLLSHEPAMPWGSLYPELLAAHVPHFSGGTYAQVLAANAELSLGVITDRLEQLRPLRVLAMFLLGAAAAHLRLAEPDARGRGVLPAIAVIAVPLAIALAVAEQLVAPTGGLAEQVHLVAATLAGPSGAVAYASVLVIWWGRDGRIARSIRRALAPAGRMALTNYLMQSAVCVPLFYGFGLGLFAELAFGPLLLWVLALFTVQLLVSHLWLSYFRQGPLEWLWRWQIQGTRPAFLNHRLPERKES